MATELNTRIADLLRDAGRAKAESRSIRTEMIAVAVNDLGIPQEEAMRIDLQTFLDGYLVGKGVTPSRRKTA